MKYILTLFIYALAVLPLAAQTDVVLTAPDVKGYPVNRVPFRLMENGSIVESIDTSRLRLLEDGISLPFLIDCPERVAQSVSVAIGLERSLDNNFGKAKQAARDFVETMQWTEAPNNASYWSFATNISREVDVVRDSGRIWNEINGTDVAGFPFNGTPLWETMHRAVEDIVEYGTEPVRAIVFFTDGRNNTSYFSTSREDVITRAQTDGVRIYAVAVASTSGDQNALADMCTRTGGIMRVEGTPGALQDIYEHMSQPSEFDYWCTLEYTSPLCPNGSSRNVTIEYDFPSAGRISETVGYTAPFRERDLTRLNFYASPRIAAFDAGDTLWAAFGVYLESDVLLGDIRLQLNHPGLLAAGPPELLEGLSGWNTDIQPVPGFTVVNLATPAESVQDSGTYRWFRLMFVAQASDTAEFVATLTSDETQCLFLKPYALNPGYRGQLDTVLSTRGSLLNMPFRVIGAVPPEGVQRVTAELSFNVEEVVPSAMNGVVFENLPPGWTVVRDVFTAQASLGVMQIELAGPPVDDASQICSINMFAEPVTAYLRPVLLNAVAVNPFDLEALYAAGSGLVVIRDSCHNQYSVAQQGLAVRGPAPNPMYGSALFELRVSEPMVVTVSVYNALGVECSLPLSRDLPEGTSSLTLPVNALEGGVYMVRFASEKGVVTQRMIVER